MLAHIADVRPFAFTSLRTAHIGDLRICARISLRPYVLRTYVCAFMFGFVVYGLKFVGLSPGTHMLFVRMKIFVFFSTRRFVFVRST